MRKAVIDVGSNSLLLLVEERAEDRWALVTERSVVTALGEGTKATGLLDEPGMLATLATLREMFAQARDNGAEEIVAAATMAVRIARNQAEFLTRCAAQGTPVTVLSGDDEARLGFESVASDPVFADRPRLSIIDPGGQSTELVTAQLAESRRQVDFRRSFAVGTLGLRGDLLADESPLPPAILAASAAIDDTIGLCYLRGMAGDAVVLGATGTNLASMRLYATERHREQSHLPPQTSHLEPSSLRQTEWRPDLIHGTYLDFEDVSRAVGNLMPLTDAARRAVPGIEPGRERTIHIGALVLERFLDAIGAPGCYVSVRGWRHALLENPFPGR